MITACALAMSFLRCCNSLVVGNEVRLFEGSGLGHSISFVISSSAGQKSSTLYCALVTIVSLGSSCCFPLLFWSVGVFREFWAINIGDTTSLRIQATFTTLSFRERDEVNQVIDMSSG